MLRATKVFVRSNAGTPWYEFAQEYTDHNQQTYTDTNLRLSADRTVSVDGLTMTVVTEWQDQSAYDQYMNDPVCLAMFALRKAYNEANGIVGRVPVTETV